MWRLSFSQSAFLILIPLFSSSKSQARERSSLKQLWNLPPRRDISYKHEQTTKGKNQELKHIQLANSNRVIYLQISIRSTDKYNDQLTQWKPGKGLKLLIISHHSLGFRSKSLLSNLCLGQIFFKNETLVTLHSTHG